MNNQIDQKFLDRLKEYTEHLGNLREVYYREERPDEIAPPITVSLHRKFAKVFAGNSPHTVIVMENGDILRANMNGSAHRAAGVRGNIFDDDCGISCVGPFCVRRISKKKAWPFTRQIGN